MGGKAHFSVFLLKSTVFRKMLKNRVNVIWQYPWPPVPPCKNNGKKWGYILAVPSAVPQSSLWGMILAVPP